MSNNKSSVWPLILIGIGLILVLRSGGIGKVYGAVLFLVGALSWFYLSKNGFKNNNVFKEKSHRDASLEPAILRAARERFGILTPTLLAVECNITIEEATAQLEYLAAKGVCTVEVNAEGRIQYHFPDFLPPHQ